MADLVAKTPRTSQKRAEFGSDVIVDLLKAYDIPYAFFNPGSTFRGLHDSIVNYGGNTKPEVILCCHEAVSVFMAHGYAKATGKPTVAIVHDTCGLTNAAMAIFNAWCDRIPLIVLGGTAPMDSLKRRPRTDWHHSALIHGNFVRDFVKWDDQPAKVSNFAESFMRAYRIAMTPPTGPVYVCYDAELQEEQLSQPVELPDVTRYAPPLPIGPNMDAMRQAALWLVEARNPVMMADYVYRNRQLAQYIVELAELLAIPIVDRGRYAVNFSPNHPLYVSGAEKEVLSEADLVLSLDAIALYADVSSKDMVGVTPNRYFTEVLSPDARVVQISLKQLQMKSWSHDFGRLQPVDLDILADSALALQQLIVLCREMIGQDAGKLERYRQRYERMRGIHNELKTKWAQQAAGMRDDIPISVARLTEELGKVVKGEDWVLVHDQLGGFSQKLWEWSGPERWLGHAGGGGLGFGPGGSIGAALAYKGSGKLCIDLNADGDMLYTPSALWTAAHYQIPLLFVMFNNRAYFNAQQHAQRMAKERGRPESNKIIGTQIDNPAVDFAKIAQGFGIYGEGPILKPEDLRPALERALKVVKEKKAPALVDVVTQAR